MLEISGSCDEHGTDTDKWEVDVEDPALRMLGRLKVKDPDPN